MIHTQAPSMTRPDCWETSLAPRFGASIATLEVEEESDFVQSLEAYGVDRGRLVDRVRVRTGTQSRLDSAEGSAIRPHLLRAHSARQFKTWIGTDDVLAARLTSPPAVPLPGAPSASHSRWSELDRAAWHFLFRDSNVVRAWEGAIEALGPFPVAVYAARNLVIESGASLIVSGPPAVLLFEHLTIEDGGALQVFAVCKALVGRLVRAGGPSLVP